MTTATLISEMLKTKYIVIMSFLLLKISADILRILTPRDGLSGFSWEIKTPARMNDRNYALFYDIVRALLQKIIINLDLHLSQR